MKKALGISISVVSFFIFVLSLVLAIKSFYFGNYGEDGLEFSINENYIILCLASIIGMLDGIYYAVNQNPDSSIIYSLAVAAFGLLSFYNLGAALKAMNKGKELAAYESNLWLGLTLLVPAVISGFKFCLNYFKKDN